MSTTVVVTDIVNSTLSALTGVVPLPMQRQQPSLVQAPRREADTGVVVGFKGSAHGRIVITGSQSTFSAIASTMYGMELAGEMLQSFIGELGNMIVGTMATHASRSDLRLDISPPTVIADGDGMPPMERAMSIPILIHDVGPIEVLLSIDALR